MDRKTGPTTPNRRTLPKLLGIGSALLLTACGVQEGTVQSASTPDQKTHCEVSKETRSFTPGAGQGMNDMVLAVAGSGQGEGDPCWSETEAAVEVIVGSDPVQENQTYQIPVSVKPKD